MKDPQGHDQSPGTASGLSRRSFCGGTGGAASTALAAPLPRALAEAAAAGEGGRRRGHGAGRRQITLNVNGKKNDHGGRAAGHTARFAPQLPRRHRLQARLRPRHLRSLHRHARWQGRLTRAACWPSSPGQEDRDRESLHSDGNSTRSPPLSSFDAQQCGFCTPGFVVAMRAALNKDPMPHPPRSKEGLSGNICRCGTYEQIAPMPFLLVQGRKKGG